MAIEPRMWRELGLSDDEYQRVLTQLGREPSPTELAMFSVEWSEHCGYPRSRPLLKLFPKEGKYASRAEGEDAGGIEVTPGLTAIFKMESHNHPSPGRAVPGRGDGRGRDHPRYLHHGGAADCGARSVALRRIRAIRGRSSC